jgi:hypothetical protein
MLLNHRQDREPWRVHFYPPVDGTWSRKVTYERKDIAKSDDLSTGQKCLWMETAEHSKLIKP